MCAQTISKLNVIGERQRFGLRVLEAGYNVLFADLDNIFLKSPEPLLRDGDIIGERIWGRPLSLVRKWGAAICTGFYFVRSNRRTVTPLVAPTPCEERAEGSAARLGPPQGRAFFLRPTPR